MSSYPFEKYLLCPQAPIADQMFTALSTEPAMLLCSRYFLEVASNVSDFSIIHIRRQNLIPQLLMEQGEG